MKTILIPEKKYKSKVMYPVDALLIGIEDLSTNFAYTYTLEELEFFLKDNADKEIFVALNKNILNHELNTLEKALEKIKNLPITGILYYDIAVLSFIKKQQIKIPLYWAQEHFTTNYLTMNYYQREGVKGVLLSSDITKDEMLEIRKKTESTLIATVFGYLPMFVSRRHLIENYKKTFSIKDKSSLYYFEKEGKQYPILEDKNGVYAFSNSILNGLSVIPELEKNHIDYILISGLLLDEMVIKGVLDIMKDVKQKSPEEIQSQVSSLCKKPCDTGFLYKETIYRVKK